MTTILHIKSSSAPQGSVTREIGITALERLKAQAPHAKVIERDLVKTAVPHVDPQFVGAMFSGKPDATELALSNQLVDELFASDIILIESPMYNFGIPSVLKAWIDHIARAGKTFRYTPTGPEGLLKGKQAILILGSGGVYSDGPMKIMDHQGTYLRAVLQFIGVTHVETITVEGVAMGPDKKSEALARAAQQAALLTQHQPAVV
jgi:FMN-dependent NADH-azoreductase